MNSLNQKKNQRKNSLIKWVSSQKHPSLKPLKNQPKNEKVLGIIFEIFNKLIKIIQINSIIFNHSSWVIDFSFTSILGINSFLNGTSQISFTYSIDKIPLESITTLCYGIEYKTYLIELQINSEEASYLFFSYSSIKWSISRNLEK